ncbi:hypothetical protein BN4901_0423 [Citrobacter europaeus]|uniref:Uncharacterized protein n=1 Tax=Citrobacter europaeus TaxID=1914243 RepID=A0ABY0JXE6_9ENTR|nr:hypothetical protein BN4901_0423 [Citrobacter europaeus]
MVVKYHLTSSSSNILLSSGGQIINHQERYIMQLALFSGK